MHFNKNNHYTHHDLLNHASTITPISVFQHEIHRG